MEINTTNTKLFPRKELRGVGHHVLGRERGEGGKGGGLCMDDVYFETENVTYMELRLMRT